METFFIALGKRERKEKMFVHKLCNDAFTKDIKRGKQKEREGKEDREYISVMR